MKLLWWLAIAVNNAAPTFLVAQESAAPDSVIDPSPHVVRTFVSDSTRLQFLDWGGTGPLLIFLHGWGSTAHVFDDIAPQFTDRFRVVALTQRAFGESESPSSGYTVRRYADDVIELMRELRAERANVAGHSFGGWVVTELASVYSDRIQRVVYLDAAYDMARAGTILNERPFARPPTTGIRNNTEYFEWLKRYFFGFWTPALEADARINAVHWDHRVARAALEEAMASNGPWDRVKTPALAICAIADVRSEFPWIEPDSAGYAAAKRYVLAVRRPFQRSECERFRRTVPNAKTVELIGHHFIFASRAPEVTKLMRRFLSSK